MYFCKPVKLKKYVVCDIFTLLGIQSVSKYLLQIY